jgi:hypothetical protein
MIEGRIGYEIMDSWDDDDKGIYLTVWGSEEMMVRSFFEVKEDLFTKVENITIGASEFSHNMVRAIQYLILQSGREASELAVSPPRLPTTKIRVKPPLLVIKIW